MENKRSYWVLALLLLSAVLIAYYIFRPIAINVVSPTRGKAIQAVYATGAIEPVVSVEVAAFSAARLIEINATEGQEVAAGFILGKLENKDLLQSIEEMLARENLAQSEFERSKKLLTNKATSKQEYEKTEAELSSARAARISAEARASYLNLVAPANCIVIRRDGEVGEIIKAGQTVFWLSCSEAKRITALVDEEDIPLISLGQQVLIHSDAYPDKIFEGILSQITPQGDPVARAFRVRIQFKETDELKIGMTVENNILVNEKDNALLVPSAAVLNSEVWLVKNGRLSKQKVLTGIQAIGQTEILKGLNEKSLLVVDYNAAFENDMKVRVNKLNE